MEIYVIRSYVQILLFVVVGSLMAGCAGSRSVVSDQPPTELPSGFPNHSAQTIHRALINASDSLDAFEASGTVELRTPEDRNAYNAHIRQRTNDSLLVSLSPGWGIIAARGLATHDSVFVYDRFHHRLYYGALRSVERVLPELASVSALFDNLTGTVVPDEGQRWRVRADSTHYILNSRKGRQQYRVVVDPRLWRVIRYEVRTPQGTVLERRQFSDFRRVDSVYMPHEITVNRPLQETRLTVQYKSVRPNPGQLAFSFPVSPGATRIPIMQEVE